MTDIPQPLGADILVTAQNCAEVGAYERAWVLALIDIARSLRRIESQSHLGR